MSKLPRERLVSMGLWINLTLLCIGFLLVVTAFITARESVKANTFPLFIAGSIFVLLSLVLLIALLLVHDRKNLLVVLAIILILSGFAVNAGRFGYNKFVSESWGQTDE
jgi:cell division protein FtsW (lipid II flippase)